jgi:hypothetical protein
LELRVYVSSLLLDADDNRGLVLLSCFDARDVPPDGTLAVDDDDVVVVVVVVVVAFLGFTSLL